MKSFFTVLVWFGITVPTLIFSLSTYQAYSHTKGGRALIRQTMSDLEPGKFSFAAVPRVAFEIKTALASEDARTLVIERYMRRWSSPMLPYVHYLIDVSDTHGVDPYLVVAIAQQESNLGKLMPPSCHNAWGWGIHSEGTLCFDTWEEGINTFISGLADNYHAYGLYTPEAIMTKYNSTSPGGAWAKGVSYFLAQLESGQF